MQKRVAELGREITRDYRGQTPLFVGVLRAAAVFLADLIRHVDLTMQVDFVAVSSYGAGTATSGHVRLVKDLEADIEGRDVILVEAIVDTGLTVDFLLKSLQSRGLASIQVCSLLSKPSRRLVAVPVAYLGFEIPDLFVVGYGLDFAQQYRNLPFVAALRNGAEKAIATRHGVEAYDVDT